MGGQVDAIDFVPPNQIDQLTGSGAQLQKVDGTAVGWMTLNEAIKPLDEAAVRCALAYAVDREAIARNVYFGNAVPAKSVIPSSTAYYDANTDPITYDLRRPRSCSPRAPSPTASTSRSTCRRVTRPASRSRRSGAPRSRSSASTSRSPRWRRPPRQELYNTEKYSVRISAWTNDTPDPDEMMGAGLDYNVQNALHTGYRNEEVRDLVLAGPRRARPGQAADDLLRDPAQGQPGLPVHLHRRGAAAVRDHREGAGLHAQRQGKYAFEDVWKQP